METGMLIIRGKFVYKEIKRVCFFAMFLVFITHDLKVSAQNTDPLIYTVGKVFQTDNGRKAYILWQPGNSKSTFGKQFAIYRKVGKSTSPGQYELMGRTKLQTSQSSIKALLKLGLSIDIDAESVASRINTLYAETLSQDPSDYEPSPSEPGNVEAKRLAYLLSAASQNDQTLQRIAFLGRTHPGIYMAMGHGYVISAQNEGVFTYEVRETDAIGTNIRVIGRVTLDPNQPSELPRPSRPYQVLYKSDTDNIPSPRDHLVAKFRWGTPEPLRRMFPQTFGFNLYRVSESKAIEMGWHRSNVFPDVGTMIQLVEESASSRDPEVKLVNRLPVFAGKLMSELEAADLDYDKEIFFTHDDNDPPTNPFQDGETFYYFVSARDIAGHPGLISSGTKVVICDRIPPKAPVIESVTNVFESSSINSLKKLQGNQHFRVRIRQSDQQGSEAIKKYYIYRWEDGTQHVREGGNWENNIVAEISDFDRDSDFIDWNDNDSDESPMIIPGDDSKSGQSWWYTVRSEDSSSCIPGNISPHSRPVYGVLRDRVGPGRSGGLLSRCIVHPTVRCGEITSDRLEKQGLKSDFHGFVLCLERRDKMLRSFEYELEYNGQVIISDSQDFSFSDTINKAISFSDKIPVNEVIVKVRSKTSTGILSEWVTCFEPKIILIKGEVPVMKIIGEIKMSYTPVKRQNLGSIPPSHDVIGIGGIITGPRLDFTIPQGSKEYRIFRRVGDNGNFQMLDRGSADGPEFPEDLLDIQFIDPAPPTESGVEVCYFVQVFDRNGNSGPRVKIGCVLIRSNDLATPMLYDPEYLVQNENMGQIRLKWFCDPVGVKRFEIWAASMTSPDPSIESVNISPPLGLVQGSLIKPTPPASDLSFNGYQTKSVESGAVGQGGEFSIKLKVPTNQSLFFSVRAVGDGPYIADVSPGNEARTSGPFSNLVNANWRPNLNADQDPDIIPWPALSVPGVSSVDAVVANYKPGEGPLYAFPYQKVGGIESGSAWILMGAMESIRDEKNGLNIRIPFNQDPLSILFSFRKQNIHPVSPENLESIVPFVVYRHQLPTTENPNIVPNLVQVSPLIDRISYKDHDRFREIKDPFFEFIDYLSANEKSQFKVPIGGTFSRDLIKSKTQLGHIELGQIPDYLRPFNTLVYWVDKMPVVSGARYQYLIVHFTDLGEIDRIIPTNFVDQP